MKLKNLIFIFLIFSSLQIFSQTVKPELVASAGETFVNTNYQLDWSIGECLTETYSSNDYVLTQGFQQPNLIITNIDDFAEQISIKVFPNPTKKYLFLEFENEFYDDLDFQLSDISGKVLLNIQLSSDNTQIDFSAYQSGIYLLSIIQNNKIIKSFKIQKTN